MSSSDMWPDLRYENYHETRDTLHMYSQIIGKLRLALTPPLAQWAHAPLRLSADGLTTTPLWVGNGTLTADLDLIRHEARFERSDGRRTTIALGAPVANFYHDVQVALVNLGVNVTIHPKPQEIPDPIPFDQDTVHGVYDPTQANLLWQVLIRVASVYDLFASGFWGKQTATNWYWGGGDLGIVRFSGRPAAAPEGLPKIMVGALDAESISHTFLLGDEVAPEPIFAARAFPPPPAGVNTKDVAPVEAQWVETQGMGMFTLSYDAVRTTGDPRETLLAFLRSTYEAYAQADGWDRDLLEQQPPHLVLATT